VTREVHAQYLSVFCAKAPLCQCTQCMVTELMARGWYSLVGSAAFPRERLSLPEDMFLECLVNVRDQRNVPLLLASFCCDGRVFSYAARRL
jgi:hypothetical protein